MPTRLKTFAVAAVLAAGMSGAAMAQNAPAPGYPSGPVSGAAAGEAAGAANGRAAAGPVGAVVGGAVGTATGAVAGTANAVAGVARAPAWVQGYTYYNGGCHPAC